VLLDIVADRTGYPIEMLDLDLDLEADLSIDSIKRVEIIGALARQLDLQSAIGAGADALLEQLAVRKTLRAVLAWLDEKLPHTAPQPPAVPKPGGAAPVAPASKHAPALRKADLLLDVVSGCTGYPAEMLDLDLDLEADLSIDSIKRTEIAAQFARRWGLGDEGSAAKDALQEGLSSFKTLRAMIGWLEQRPHRPASCPAAPAAVEGDAPATIPLCRYVLRTRVQAAVRRGNIDLAGKRFLLTDDGRNVAPKIAARLAAHGATAEIIAWPEAGALMLEQNQADGLIHLANLYAPPDADAAKNLFPLMRTMLMAGAQTVLLATGLGGNTGTAEHLQVAMPGGGLAGLIKCAAREFAGTQARAVHLDPAEPADRIACLLEEEIFADDTLREVVRTGADRRVRIAVPEALPHADAHKLRLGADSVVLLTGGARGITSRAAVALARQTGCTIELVGRSPLPVAHEAWETQALIDPRALRQALLRNHRSARPADIEARVQRILADREMRAAMTQIEAAGGSCRYTALDVRDSAGFAAHIEDIYRRHGRIDGVIHGAGVIEDRLMRDKTVESFARVFDTKVRAATVLHEKIRDDVGFVVFFSSVSSVFGNRGQADYAAGNDVLDRLAHHWQARIAGRVVSVNWGPWADTGMVSDALAQDYNRKGIGLVPQDEGVAALLREIASDARDGQVLLMCGEPDRFEA
jgi:NAD(P)-dependent dehydrogenase (short-subunit alcohol dehydrogenase family)/acyl carrier protein